MITSKKSSETFLCGRKVLLYLRNRSCAVSKLLACNNHACSIAFVLGVVLQQHFAKQRNTTKWLNFTSLKWLFTFFLMLSKNSASRLSLLLSHLLSVTCPKVKKRSALQLFLVFVTLHFHLITTVMTRVTAFSQSWQASAELMLNVHKKTCKLFEEAFPGLWNSELLLFCERRACTLPTNLLRVKKLAKKQIETTTCLQWAMYYGTGFARGVYPYGTGLAGVSQTLGGLPLGPGWQPRALPLRGTPGQHCLFGAIQP